MTLGSMIALLLSGGLIAAVASIASTMMSNHSEKKRAERERANTVSDRNFELKKEAYLAALEEFNLAGLTRANGVGNMSLTLEEARARNKAMTLFDIFAPDEVREKAGKVLKFLSTPLPTTQPAHLNFMNELLNAQKELSDAIKADLGLN